jgi:hypothetical protein
MLRVAPGGFPVLAIVGKAARRQAAYKGARPVDSLGGIWRTGLAGAGNGCRFVQINHATIDPLH